MAQECLEGLNTSPHVLNRIRGQVSSHLLQIIRAQVNERVQESSDPSQWLEIARNRVGGLFKLAVVGSSLLVDLDTPNDGSLEEIGGHYGVIFMIQTVLGPLGSDQRCLARPIVKAR